MNKNHLPSVAIYCDLQNVLSISQYVNQLLDFAKSKGVFNSPKLYYNSLCKNQVATKETVQRYFSCIDVPWPFKNSADNQLIADCLEDVDSNHSPDIVILLSGDGDFSKLASTLKRWNKKIIVLGQRGNVKQKLKEVADEFHFLDELPQDELPQLVLVKTEIKDNSPKSQISYNDAVEYLKKAIKTALQQGKSTDLSYINTIMGKVVPNYQGVSSICKPDGTKFGKWSKFVAAAVADGKVGMQNQKLSLIEADKLVM